MRHAVIMAGGTGTRLWPISRKATPKQFQKLLGDQTLLQQTFERVRQVLPAEQIWVMTSDQYTTQVQEQLPEIPAGHIITEPSARNTAPAALLALLTILKEDPSAVLFGLVPADHHVGKPAVFAEITNQAFDFIEKQPEYVLTIGIRPTDANTGYGYIRLGNKLAELGTRTAFAVEAFEEKPDEETARGYLESGQYLWNGGYYLYDGQKMVEYYRQLAPELLQKVEQYLENPSAELYQTLPKEPIDKAITEKLSQLAVIPAEMEWSDIGDWAALHEILAAHHQTTEVVVGNHIGSNTKNSLIMGGSKLIATVGVEDIVVIDTESVILICKKGSVQEVKKLVEQLEENGQGELL